MPAANQAQRPNVLIAAKRSGWQHDPGYFDDSNIIRDAFTNELGTIRAIWLRTPWSDTGRWAGAIFSNARDKTDRNVWKISGTGGLLELLARCPAETVLKRGPLRSEGWAVMSLSWRVTSRGVHCDAWLLPSDARFHVTAAFGPAVDLPEGGVVRGLTWGGRRVVPFSERSDDSPWIWFGDVGRVDADGEWYARCAEEFLQAATTTLRVGGLARRPTLAVNVIGSGRGRDGRGPRGRASRSSSPRSPASLRSATSTSSW